MESTTTGFWSPGGLTETNCHYYNAMSDLLSTVTAIPDCFANSDMWTYDSTYGITFNSALVYLNSQNS